MDIKNKSFSDIKIHCQLLQKVQNNYRPFLYNDIIDWCDLVNTQRPHILWNFIYETTKKYSNLNHTCPLNAMLKYYLFFPILVQAYFCSSADLA
ncbi:hypothetical protein FF38_05559, partial [Lucilia cuprina]